MYCICFNGSVFRSRNTINCDILKAFVVEVVFFLVGNG